jgi:hypothetical protein
MAVLMYRLVESQADPEILPLQNAVLCVDCESVSNAKTDECPVCGGHSLLALARMLGGSLAAHKSKHQDGESVLFDLTIAIELKQMDAQDLNTAIEGISRLIGPRLGRGRASFHMNVEPISDGCSDGLRAA